MFKVSTIIIYLLSNFKMLMLFFLWGFHYLLQILFKGNFHSYIFTLIPIRKLIPACGKTKFSVMVFS
jgi:hypothetical protein